MRRTLVAAVMGICLAASALAVGSGTAGAARPKSTNNATPSAPTNVQVHALGNQFVISWTAPTSAGTSPVSGYTAIASKGSSVAICSTSGLTCTTIGAFSGKTYKIRVYATNASGTGPASALVTVLAGLPLPPTGLVATAGNGSASVKFTPPTIDNASIQHWTITASPGGKSCVSPNSLPCTVTGLTNGTAYTFTGTSTNPYGTSAPSLPSAAVTPATVPGVPTGVAANATTISGVPAATVTYVAPASNGGSAITGYSTVVTDSTTHTTAKVSGSSSLATVTGLNPTDVYSFSVYATNAKGNSVSSSPVQATPQGPTSVTGSNVGDGSAGIAWTPSTVTLGNPVTGYAVTTQDLTTSTTGPSTTVGSSTTSTTLVGFTLGDSVMVCVAAQNVLPNSQSTCSTFTAFAAPAAPTGVTPVSNGDGTGMVSWTAAADVLGNPVTGYQVQLTDTTASTTSSTSVASVATAAPLTLTVGDSYNVCVGSTSANATLVQTACQAFTA